MKQIFAIFLLFAMLSGCSVSDTVVKPNEMPDPQPSETTLPTVTIQKPRLPGLSCENGKYFLTLPQSGETLELSDREARFVPYITDALVAEAESKILEQTAEYGKESGFYLQITDDCLYLTMEVIKDLAPPEPTGAEAGNILSGCGIDHDHVFYSERISTQPVKDATGFEDRMEKSGIVYVTSVNKVEAISKLAWMSTGGDNGGLQALPGGIIKSKLRADEEDKELIIPKLYTDPGGSIEPTLPVNGQITRVYLLEMSAAEDYPMTETTWENLKALTPGKYYVVTQVLLSGNCDPDAPQYSFCYEDLFCLIVQEPI